jgi:hypothetical protein
MPLSRSRHILEIGVVMAKISLLLVRQPFETMITLPCCPGAVLTDVVQYTEGGQSQDADLRPKIDRVADWVPRPIANEVCPAR